MHLNLSKNVSNCVKDLTIVLICRASNIVIVMAIGISALVIGWLIELTTKYRSFSFPIGFSLNIIERCVS